MQTYWQLNGQRGLLLFFSGWAMDEKATSQMVLQAMDLCVCYDYRTLETSDIDCWQSYDEVVVVAWSTGVWAASKLLPSVGLNVRKAIALNGTPTTVDDQTGIPRAIFQGTYDNLTAQTMQKFQRRMMGSAVAYSEFATIAPMRSLKEQKEELCVILENDFMDEKISEMHWDKAVIGMEDLIFPPGNQRAYWTGRTEIVERQIPHFPFFELNDWDKIR